MLSTDVAISGETQSRVISTEKRTQTSKSDFLESLDDNSRQFFEQLLNKLTEHGLVSHWGGVGFSLNVDFDGTHVSICEGYPIKPKTRHNAVIYGIFSAIEKKLSDTEQLLENYKTRFLETGVFVSSGKNVRWTISVKPSEEVIQNVLDVFIDLAEEIKNYHLKE